MDFIAQTGIPHQFRTDIGLGLLQEEAFTHDETTEQPGLEQQEQKQAQQLVPHKSRKNSKAKTWKTSGLRYGFEKMRVVFLQLPLFEKKEPECMDIFDCWIYVLNNMEHLKEIPFLDKYPVFRKLAAIGDLRKLSAEERDLYDEDIKIMRDLYATDKWEKKKRRIDIEKAQTEGMAKGRAEGRAEGKLDVAKKMLLAGLPDVQIMDFTGLTQEQIDSLRHKAL